MPTVPKQTKCVMLGCTSQKAKLSLFCIEHGGKDTYTAKRTKKRAEFNNAYNESAWKRIRIAQLSKQPLCAACFQRKTITPATQVDHVFPWAHFGKDAFYMNIFQSLCAECHGHKGQLEDRGIFRHYADPVKDYAARDYPSAVHQALGKGFET